MPIIPFIMWPSTWQWYSQVPGSVSRQRTRKLSAGPIVRESSNPPGTLQRCPWTWKVWKSSPSVSTSHWTRSPTFARRTGVLPTNALPLIVMKPRCCEKKTTNSRSGGGSSRALIEIAP